VSNNASEASMMATDRQTNRHQRHLKPYSHNVGRRIDNVSLKNEDIRPR